MSPALPQYLSNELILSPSGVEEVNSFLTPLPSPHLPPPSNNFVEHALRLELTLTSSDDESSSLLLLLESFLDSFMGTGFVAFLDATLTYKLI
jgi:hypothetical protein